MEFLLLKFALTKLRLLSTKHKTQIYTLSPKGRHTTYGAAPFSYFSEDFLLSYSHPHSIASLNNL